MGCASSKPSSSKTKNKDSSNTNSSSSNSHKQKSNIKKNVNVNSNTNIDKFEKIKNEQIKIDQNLINQIEINLNKVIDYIVKTVRKDLNAELVKNGSGNNNFVAVIQAAAAAQDNDDLITDVASKAIFLIKSGRCNTTYRNLNDSLKSSHFLCKNQTHKIRVCELTTETIFNCLTSLNENSHNLLDLLNDLESNKSFSVDENNNIPEAIDTNNKTEKVQEDKWENAVLLSRSEANEVARMLFYSNRARPVIHASPKAKDAYFVNKQLNENVEVTVARDEIDEILHTFNQPVLNNLQNQHQYFNDGVHDFSANLVVSNEVESPSSELRLSNNNENFSSNEESNQEKLEENFQEIKTSDEDKLIDANESLDQNDETNANILLATLAAVTIISSNQEKTEENLQNEITLNKIENNDIETTNSINTNIDNNLENESSSLKDKDLTDSFNNTATTTLSNESNNQNHSSNLNNTNYEDANTTLNSLNNNNHLDNQTNSSEEGKLDPILNQSLLDDRYYNNHSFKEEQPLNDPNNDAAATLLQANFKGNLVRKEQEEAAAITIQSTYRGYKTRKEIKPKLKALDNNLKYNTDLEPVKEEDTSLNKTNSIDSNITSVNSDNNINNELDQAAIKIQATYRGFKTRKELKKDPKDVESTHHQTKQISSLEDYFKSEIRNRNIQDSFNFSSTLTQNLIEDGVEKILNKNDNPDPTNAKVDKIKTKNNRKIKKKNF